MFLGAENGDPPQTKGKRGEAAFLPWGELEEEEEKEEEGVCLLSKAEEEKTEEEERGGGNIIDANIER